MSKSEQLGVSIFAWNTEDSFSATDKAKSAEAHLTIEEADPDIAVLTEAYRSDRFDDATDWVEALADSNHEILRFSQEMSDPRPDAHDVVVRVKSDRVVSIDQIELASRYASKAVMVDPTSDREYTVFGYHGNDKSEDLRIGDVRALGEYIDEEEPTIVAGDLNTIAPVTPLAKALRIARPFTTTKAFNQVFRPAPPNPDNPPKGLPRMGSLAQRLTDMASGTAMSMYQEFGLRDVDPKEIPTFKKVLPVKLDHILVSADFHLQADGYIVLNPEYVSEDLKFKSVSDHKAIMARLTLGDRP